MKKKKFVFALLSLTVFASYSFAKNQTKQQSYIDYIQKYAPVAIVKMQEHGIPASITLAQGILESGAGQSELAKKSNNHFGIKCHDWQGEKVYHDDDQKQECFRKYKSAELSYEDHSQFLKKQRYQSLFSLDIRDYKAWAKGLKECGYATDPNYPKRLIDIIENYQLYVYDNGTMPTEDLTKKGEEEDVLSSGEKPKSTMGQISPYRIHKVFKTGKFKTVTAGDGDTYESIADEFNLHKWQIRRYNKIKRKEVRQPQAGETVIIGK